jgi:predicted XRE-type DNA-binding protein
VVLGLIMPTEKLDITNSSGNVFADFGFDPAQAEVMKLRAEVMIFIEMYLKETGQTQAQAANQLGITQPRVFNTNM